MKAAIYNEIWHVGVCSEYIAMQALNVRTIHRSVPWRCASLSYTKEVFRQESGQVEAKVHMLREASLCQYREPERLQRLLLQVGIPPGRKSSRACSYFLIAKRLQTRNE